jgi:hypothetical protein
LRKTPTIALGLAASLAFAGAAIAQTDATPSHTVAMTVKPSKAGTKKKPKAISLKIEISNNKAAGTTASRIEIFGPKTLKLNTKGFPVCSEDTLINDGPAACPKGSKVGSGTAAAVVNPRGAAPAPVAFTNTFYVAGRNRLNINLISSDQAINRTFPVKVGAGGGKFGQKLTIDIPGDLQQPAPGIFSALTDITTTLKGTAGKGSKKHGIYELTGCTGGKLNFQTRITYAPNPTPPAAPTSLATDSVKCSR